MKLRSTTPVSKKGIAARACIVAIAILMAAAGSMQFFQTPQAYADVYDDKIAALNRQIAAYNAETARLAKEADSLQKQLSVLANQKATIQAHIDTNQAKHDKLQQEIAASEQEIVINRDALGETLADMYVDDSISPLEMLASSNTISDFIDKQEQRATIRDNLSKTIEEIKALKAKLEKDRKEVAAILEDQKAQRTILANKESERQTLLAQTKGSESAYRKLISNKKDQIAEIRAEQAAVAAAIANGANGASGGSASNVSNYPFYPNGCGFINDGYGYYRCQCGSYVAYRLADDSRNRGFSSLGHAYNWWNYGKTIRQGNVARGDVIVWLNGPYGHVMFVESVSGGMIYFTDFNGFGGALSPGQGSISERDATSGAMKVIRFN